MNRKQRVIVPFWSLLFTIAGLLPLLFSFTVFLTNLLRRMTVSTSLPPPWLQYCLRHRTLPDTLTRAGFERASSRSKHGGSAPCLFFYNSLLQ